MKTRFRKAVDLAMAVCSAETPTGEESLAELAAVKPKIGAAEVSYDNSASRLKSTMTPDPDPVEFGTRSPDPSRDRPIV